LEITENPDIEEPGAAVIVRNPTVFSEIAQYGDTSEALARSLGKQIRGFLAASASIETHLADQIILPLFFTAGGSFLTKGSSEHLESCIKVLELFTGQKVKTEKDGKCLVVNVPKFKRENHD
jgi:RNA 3'-terminal phosphate cyclase (ATP)